MVASARGHLMTYGLLVLGGQGGEKQYEVVVVVKCLTRPPQYAR